MPKRSSFFKTARVSKNARGEEFPCVLKLTENKIKIHSEKRWERKKNNLRNKVLI